MKQLWELIKVQISTLLTPPDKKSNGKKLLYFASPFLVLLLMYSYTEGIYSALGANEKWLILYVMGFAAFCISFITIVTSAQGHLTKFKDFDFLMSLPVKKEKILIAKIVGFITIYSSIGFIMMIPPIVLYGIEFSMGVGYYLIAFLGTIPVILIPIILSATLMMFIQKIPGINRFPNLIRNIFTGVLLIVTFGISFSISSSDGSALSSSAILSLVENTKLFGIVPWTYAKAVLLNDYLAIFGLIVAAMLLFMAWVSLFSKWFIDINVNAGDGIKAKNFKLKHQTGNSVFGALFKKELKYYFTHFMYILNTSLGSIMILAGVIYLVWLSFDDQTLSEFITIISGTNSGKTVIFSLVAFVLGSFAYLSNTAMASISLEGKNFWILKSSPIKPWEVFNAKAFVNVLVVSVPNFIALVIIGLLFKFDAPMFIVGILIIVVQSLSVGYLGVAINLIFPKLKFTNEMQVIKQSASAFAAMIIAMILIGIHGFIAFNNSFEQWWQAGFLYLGLNVIYLCVVYLWLQTKGHEKYRNLYN